MNAIEYIREALRPGGTLKRFVRWVSILLFAQAAVTLLPILQASAPLMGWAFAFLVALITLCSWLLNGHSALKLLLFITPLTGIVLGFWAIQSGYAHPVSAIWLLSWGLSTLISEKREYMGFGMLLGFVGVGFAALLASLLVPSSFSGDGWIQAICAGSAALLNGYLLVIDHTTGRYLYLKADREQEMMHTLSNRLSEILTAEGELTHLLWKVSHDCIPLLGLEDCVIYLYDEERNALVQTAAYGEKSPDAGKIINPIELRPGEGVVGRAFASGEVLSVPEVRLFPGYIVDDMARSSELAVPIRSNGQVVGVIDSEHSIKGFFRERHARAFQIIATFCGIKITEYQARKSILAAQSAQQEIDRYKELDELKNRFIANVSHDLKTPISLIKAPAAKLAARGGDAEVAKLAAYILKNTEHLLRVVNQLLQLNRVDHGEYAPFVKTAKVDELFQPLRTQYEGLALERELDFMVSVESFECTTDVFRLEQIVHNLLQNAFRYTQKGGQVELEIAKEGDQMLIRVSDNGPGIPKAMRNLVFERFFKVDVNNHEGTGIGLSLVKEYVTALNGQVHLQSALGEGTTVIVVVPVKLEPDGNSVQEPALPMAMDDDPRPMLLIAEDHADLNNFIAGQFDGEYKCLQAYDGEQALSIARSYRPDLIVTDLMMPKLNGEELVKQLRHDDETAHIPVVVLSAKGHTTSKIELYELDAENYITKPFEIEELQAVIKNVLNRRKRLLEQFDQTFIDTNHCKSELETERHPALITEAMEYIRQRLDDPELTTTVLATQFQMGRNRFQKEIKEATGLTPVEFIRHIRLTEAKKMLSESSISVSEVAYAVGFNNLSYFTRSFKAEFGCLPSSIAV